MGCSFGGGAANTPAAETVCALRKRAQNFYVPLATSAV
jgi:hypothetical protein